MGSENEEDTAPVPEDPTPRVWTAGCGLDICGLSPLLHRGPCSSAAPFPAPSERVPRGLSPSLSVLPFLCPYFRANLGGLEKGFVVTSLLGHLPPTPVPLPLAAREPSEPCHPGNPCSRGVQGTQCGTTDSGPRCG